MNERIAFSLPGIPMVLVLLGAIIAARSRIVEGAVSMVHMALEQLTRMVVLCGERGTQPVVNTRTLYT